MIFPYDETDLISLAISYIRDLGLLPVLSAGLMIGFGMFVFRLLRSAARSRANDGWLLSEYDRMKAEHDEESRSLSARQDWEYDNWHKRWK